MARELALSILELGHRPLIMWLHTTVNPPADEWDAALETIVDHRAARNVAPSGMCHLVVSDGGAPSAKQRAQLLHAVWKGKPGKIAVVTPVLDNPIKRGVATALTWLNPLSRFYEPSGFRLALQYLDVTEHTDAIWNAYGELAQQLLPSNNALHLISTSVGLPRQPSPARHAERH
ncbi:MAG: hypothetical protein WKG00_18385 [Polyangiaceae bacterium]